MSASSIDLNLPLLSIPMIGLRVPLVQSAAGRRAALLARPADRIRDELAAMGVALKDAMDPRTGEITTTWEVKA